MKDNLREPGDVVEVYTDPISEKDLEGNAKLIKPIGAMLDGGFQYWKVNFVDDPYTETYIRKIRAILGN